MRACVRRLQARRTHPHDLTFELGKQMAPAISANFDPTIHRVRYLRYLWSLMQDYAHIFTRFHLSLNEQLISRVSSRPDCERCQPPMKVGVAVTGGVGVVFFCSFFTHSFSVALFSNPFGLRSELRTFRWENVASNDAFERFACAGLGAWWCF